MSHDIRDINTFIIKDYLYGVQSTIACGMVEDPRFNLGEWYEYRLATHELGRLEFEGGVNSYVEGSSGSHTCGETLELNGVQVDHNKYPTL